MSGRAVVLRGDAAHLPLGTASVDAVVCDPPYGLEFMGREWDTFGGGQVATPGIGDRQTPWVSNQGWNGFRCRGCGHLAHGGSPCRCERPDFARADNRWRAFQAWCEAWAAECLRVLKPGGYLLAFGGTRTYHRLASGIEDAGFEIRDSLHWLYGSGFPKGKACLKPSHEPIVLARKPALRSAPLPGLDACRIDAGQDYRDKCASVVGLASNRNGDAYGEWTGERADSAHDAGRWPPNVLLSEEAAAEMDRQSGNRPGFASQRDLTGSSGTKSVYGDNMKVITAGGVREGFNDSGGASRFFPVFRYEAKADAASRPRLPDGTAWPTVKPVPLLQWLVRLVTPPGGIILDPFCGTGPTGEAAIIEGFDAILLDKDPQAIALTRVRLAKPIQPLMFAPEPEAGPAAPKPAASAQDSLFDDLPGVA